MGEVAINRLNIFARSLSPGFESRTIVTAKEQRAKSKELRAKDKELSSSDRVSSLPLALFPSPLALCPKALHDRLLWLSSNQAINELSVFEDQHRGNAGYLIARRDIGVFIDVEFSDSISAL